MTGPRDRCICGEELDENGECPECDVTYDTSDPALDDPQEEDLT